LSQLRIVRIYKHAIDATAIIEITAITVITAITTITTITIITAIIADYAIIPIPMASNTEIFAVCAVSDAQS
jgi:hypothetical protein